MSRYDWPMTRDVYAIAKVLIFKQITTVIKVFRWITLMFMLLQRY